MADRALEAADGTLLHYREEGDPAGPAVLFLHGLGHGTASWRHQLDAPELAGCRRVALDLRGHGASGWRDDDRFDGPTWAGDVDQVITTLGLAPVTIIAWSYAGLVLADYVRVKGTTAIHALGLVAAAVRAGYPDAYADYGRGALPEGFLADDEETHDRADVVFVAESAGTRGFDAAGGEELVHIVHGTPREVLRRLLARVIDNTDLWSTVHVRTLLSHGTVDRINLPIISERQLQTIQGATISRYEGVGHMPFWERPDRFNAELLSLVRGDLEPRR